MATASVTQVLEALTALYSSKDKESHKQADRWLRNFQKKPEAWATADYLLKAENSNAEIRLFAAQTFRAKITYDLRDLDAAARVSLRDSLLELLVTLSESHAIMTQLCLAMADLAIQMVEWKDAIQDMVNKLGNTPKTAVWLIEFLKVLPEEMIGNSRLPLSEKDCRDQKINLLQNNADKVIQLLSMYMQSSVGNIVLQENVFRCLSSWLRTGDVNINKLGESPLLDIAFGGLDHSDLFEVAVDLVCEIIYETRKIAETRHLIENIYARFGTVVQSLRRAKEQEDSDAVRGYCRVLAEAGETYVQLLVEHPGSFGILLDGILECTAYNDFDIIPITFNFWYELTNKLKTERFESVIPAFTTYFDALVNIIIGHLHYPNDLSEMTAEERDEFREFRHEMGDTLKDCCRVLTPSKCLEKPLHMLQTLLNQPGQATWQQIEAPIFSLRAMGSEVPDDENQVMPQILGLLSKLPDHPKIRYAATLVISRYSLWTRKHPEYITYQLNFISAGFQNDEVAAASALALKHLCKDCSELLVDYLGQLHPFYLNVVKSLPFSDAFEVTEAIAHILASLPPSEIHKALQMFCLPLAQDLHAMVSKDVNTVTQDDYAKIGDSLEQISAFIEFIHPEIPVGQPHPCIAFVQELWPVFDLCLANFGSQEIVCSQLCRCFKNCVQSYKLHFVPLLPQLVERLAKGFEMGGHSAYLWVTSKVIREYADKGPETVTICFDLVERQSNVMFTMAGNQKLDDMPDVVDDYFRMITAFLDCSPTPLIQSPLLASIFQAGLAGLSIKEGTALTSVITFYRRLLYIALSVDELMPGDGPRNAAAIGQNGAHVIKLFMDFGSGLVSLLFSGLMYHYNWDVISDVASIMKSLSQTLPTETAQWVIGVVNAIPEESLQASEKNEFLHNYMSAVQEKEWPKARRILSNFITTYRRKNTRS